MWPRAADLKADLRWCRTQSCCTRIADAVRGLRGMIYTEIEVRGAKTDLHSGMYGGRHPIRLCPGADSRESQDKSRILIPGFYDDVVPPSAEELAAWKSLPFDEEHYRRRSGSRDW